MERRNISNAVVLAALYNNAKVQGLGFLHATSQDMTLAEADEILNARPGPVAYFDYLHGRVMKVDVRENQLDLRLYDRDNGVGAGERAIREAVAKPHMQEDPHG